MFKKRSKIIVAIALALVLTLALFTLCACDGDLQTRLRDLEAKVNGYEADFSEKTITLYIGDGSDGMQIVTRKAFLHDVLKDLSKEGKLSRYEYSGGELSPYVTAVGDLAQDEEHYKYYSVWHSVDEFSLKTVYNGFMPGRGTQRAEGEGDWQTVFVVTTYNDTLLYYSNVGVGLLPVVDKASYAIFVD